MSEDTDAKTGGRRRRTTRAGRRRAARAPADGVEPSTPEQWSPAWSADPEAVPGEVVEETEDESEGGEGDCSSEAAEPADAAEPAEARGEGEDEDDRPTAPVEAHGGGEDEDKRPTAEIHVTPMTLAQLQDEEKTNPRIRLGDLGIDYPEQPTEPPAQPIVSFWSRPSTRRHDDDEATKSTVAIRPAVVITPAKIISDRPPPMRSAKAFEAAPLVAGARPWPGQPAPPAPPAIPPAAARAPARPPPSPVPPPPPAPAAASEEPANAPAAPEIANARDSAAASSYATQAAAPLAAEQAPTAAVAAAPAAQVEDRSFEQFDATDPPPPPEPAAEPAADRPVEGVDEGGLQLVDVDVSELEQQRRSRTPPPPPPDARAKQAPPKRPPPPPGGAKPEDERQKRKQVRQWWERFFSDDYLMSVRPATPAQIAKQVDFIEQSLGVSKGGTILDVGCGLGLHAAELTRRGYLVVGLDLSLAMITRAAELAQQQQLKLNVVHADIREMEFDGAFDGAICMGTTFGFFDDDANRDVLARLNHALKPGGRALLDMVNRDYVIRLQPNLVWFEGDECVCMEESDFNYFNSRLTVKRTMMREDGKQSNAEYSVRLYSLHELGLMMQQVGFRVIEVSGQEAIRGAFFGANSPRMLMLAERRAPGRPSVVMPLERSSAADPGRATAMPPERGSAEIPKTPKPE